MRRALAVFVALLGVVTVGGFLDRFSWFFELWTMPRLQYAALLVASAIVALLLRALRLAAIATLLALLNLVVVAPSWHSVPAAEAHAPRLRVLVFNLEAGNVRYADIDREIERFHAQLLGLIELSSQAVDGLNSTLAGFPHRIVFPRAGGYGLGLFSRLPLSHPRIERLPERTMVATVQLRGRPVTFLLTHPHTPFGPHAGSLHRRQFANLGRLASSGAFGRDFIICGDLNTVPWAWPERHLIDVAHLHDSHAGHGFQTSWPSWFWPFRMPLDNCLVSSRLTVVARRVGNSVGSDHFPLYVEVAFARS